MVRIPGEGTEELIDRADEKVSTELACRLGIDAKLYFFGDDGEKVSQFVPNAVTMSAETMRGRQAHPSGGAAAQDAARQRRRHRRPLRGVRHGRGL